jgi:alkylated DNA repair dioxygenase AlkB
VNGIDGLVYVPEFLTVQDEQRLIQSIDRERWDTQLNRWRQQYGYVYDHKRQGVRVDQPVAAIPPWLVPVIETVVARRIMTRVDQAIVNNYQPGQGIGRHRDSPDFGDTVVSISLLSQVVMVFEHDHDRHDQLLAPRSLLAISRAARWKWTHCIPMQRTDVIQGRSTPRSRRVSITLRTVP